MIIKKFQEQVKAFPANIAVKAGNRTITYSELDTYANQVASVIWAGGQDREKKAGSTCQRVSLLFEHGIDMIIGVMGALMAGKTYVPLDITYPEKRLTYMLEDSESGLILTNKENFPLAEKLAKQTGRKAGILNIDSINTGDEHSQSGVNIKREESGDGNRPAYILYTSGSTGRPKGVVQTHRNVVYFIEHWIRRFSITEKDRMTMLSAFSHDAAVMDIFGALLAGATLYPYYIKTTANTNELYTLLMKEKITIWHSVPTLYRYFANTLTEKNVFYDIRWVLLGGESLRPNDLDLFRTHFPEASLVNVYGQTESSVNTTCTISQTDIFDAVCLGEPLDETQILLVTEEGDIIETMGAGEIVVASDYISPGYWRDRESSNKVFTHDDEQGRLYWTGDLGRLTMDGLIKVMGRKDFQIKIRGFRVETGEIESLLLQHEAVKEAVAIAKEDENIDNYLCVYFVSDKTVTAGEFREYLSRELPDYMIPRYFIPLEKMPLIPNGKIDRQRLPEPEEVKAAESVYVAPTDEIEKKFAAIWQEVLAVEKVGINDNFIELGGHSLLVISILSKIHREFNVELQLKDVFDNPTIKELSRLIMDAGESIFSSIQPGERKEYYIATHDQRRMFTLNQFENIGTTYNLSMVRQFNGPFDPQRFEAAFRKLIQRHEVLRTSFRFLDDRLVQVIHDYDTIDFQIQYIDANASSQAGTNDIKKIINQFIQPFDLGKAPLLRAGLTKPGKNKHLLLLDIHHIISDGMSEIILNNDFVRLYEGEELPGLKLRYRDYSEWLNSMNRPGKLEQQEEYWLNQFKGEIPMLNMPLDFSRPALQSFEGDVVGLRLGKEMTRQLNRMAKETGATLYMVLLAVFNILLHKYTGQEDIVVGSIIAGRSHLDLENIVGFFVKTLALRNQPAAHQPFDFFLEQLKNSTLEAFEHQLYPFDQLVGKLKLPENRNRNPLFDAAFVWQNMEGLLSGNFTTDTDMKTTLQAYEIKTAMFDLNFEAIETGDEILCGFQYCTKLFKRETIELMRDRFLVLVENILDKPQAKIRDLDYAVPIEKEMSRVEEVEFDL